MNTTFFISTTNTKLERNNEIFMKKFTSARTCLCFLFTSGCSQFRLAAASAALKQR